MWARIASRRYRELLQQLSTKPSVISKLAWTQWRVNLSWQPSYVQLLLGSQLEMVPFLAHHKSRAVKSSSWARLSLTLHLSATTTTAAWTQSHQRKEVCQERPPLTSSEWTIKIFVIGQLSERLSQLFSFRSRSVPSAYLSRKRSRRTTKWARRLSRSTQPSAMNLKWTHRRRTISYSLTVSFKISATLTRTSPTVWGTRKSSLPTSARSCRRELLPCTATASKTRSTRPSQTRLSSKWRWRRKATFGFNRISTTIARLRNM